MFPEIPLVLPCLYAREQGKTRRAKTKLQNCPVSTIDLHGISYVSDASKCQIGQLNGKNRIHFVMPQRPSGHYCTGRTVDGCG
jgi:hypothetical protein